MRTVAAQCLSFQLQHRTSSHTGQTARATAELGEGREHLPAQSASSGIRPNEKVVEVEAWTAAKCRVRVAEDGEPGRLAVASAMMTSTPPASSRTASRVQDRLSGRNCLEQLLVFGQLANEVEDERDVVAAGGSEDERHDGVRWRVHARILSRDASKPGYALSPLACRAARPRVLPVTGSTKLRRDFGQRFEDEQTLPEAGMRHDQIRLRRARQSPRE